MLVSVDNENGTVTIYGKTVITVPISQAGKLQALLNGKTVQYVQEVVEASGEEVLEMLAELSYDPTIRAAARNNKVVDDGRMWLHATGSGYLNVPNPKLIFDGPYDFKSLDKLGYDVIDRFPVLQDLMEKGRLAIVGTSEMNRLKKIAATKKALFEEKKYLNSDGSSIIEETAAAKAAGKRGLDDKFELVTGDEPDDEFISEYAKLAMEKGWGKSEEEAEEAE